MTKHIHAELMAQYAQDAVETETPWERWETRRNGEEYYSPLLYNPRWESSREYRRKSETGKEPEYVYSHRLVEILEDGDVNDAHSIAFATHISVYRRKAGEVTDEWVYDIPIPGALSFLLDSLVPVVKHFNSFHSLEKNGFSGGAMMAERGNK